MEGGGAQVLRNPRLGLQHADLDARPREQQRQAQAHRPAPADDHLGVLLPPAHVSLIRQHMQDAKARRA